MKTIRVAEFKDESIKAGIVVYARPLDFQIMGTWNGEDRKTLATVPFDYYSADSIGLAMQTSIEKGRCLFELMLEERKS